MKHIKVFEDFELPFKESKEKIEELSQLCFADLLDEDFKVTIDGIELYPLVDLDIYISKDLTKSIVHLPNSDSLFDYNDVKDHLITFVKLLSKDYEIDHIFFMGGWKKKSWLDKKIDKLKGSGPSGSRERKEVSVEDLTSDKVKINFKVISITIKIKR